MYQKPRPRFRGEGIGQPGATIALLWLFLSILASPFKSKRQLEAENVALRHQVIVVRRQVRGRVRNTNVDRLMTVQLYRWFPSILKALPSFSQLRQVLRSYADYHNKIRTHWG